MVIFGILNLKINAICTMKGCVGYFLAKHVLYLHLSTVGEDGDICKFC